MTQSYRFGTVEVRPSERQVIVDGRPAPLGARAFDLLVALIERRDRVVTKDELLEQVWPGLVVEENNLQVQVSTLRKILGAHSVSTIPGRGYRFTLEPELAAVPPPRRRHNLPPQLTRFIGRGHELEIVATLLERARLVTLTGSGGTGKTRLSLQFARLASGDYEDGVWLVELAPVATAEEVSRVAALVLGCKEDPSRPLLDSLARHVADSRMLVVLDNCEHVTQAAAELVRALLNASPEVKVLATSREALRIAGEMTYGVPTLPAAEAMALFLDRAQAVHPTFAANADDAAAVAEICRRLDGIPLAIELAAARVRALSVEAIAERLDDRFRLLSHGDPTALPRQQTLRASIDWSHDLLAEDERAVFRRVAVFSGGWTLDAAEAVCAGADAPHEAVLEVLSRLVERSLVETDARVERYRLLETVRQYAMERLEAAGEADGTRGRHLAYFVALVQRAHPMLYGPEQAAWLERLDRERENVLAAHAWCEHAPDGATLGLRLVAAIKIYWLSRGLLALAHRVMVEALARAPERSRERSRVLFDVGQVGCFMGRYEEARRHLEESLRIARERDDAAHVASILQPLGMACLGLRDNKAARGHLEEALAMARDQDDRRGLAAAINALAQLERVEGRLQPAKTLYTETLGIARELGDRESMAIALLNLAMVATGRRDTTHARELLREAAEIAMATGSRPAGQSVLEVSAGLAASVERFEDAARFYGAASAQAAASGLQRDAADEAFLAPWMEKAAEALGREAFAARARAAHGEDLEEALAAARRWLDVSS